jgi:Protein of unknown function (DUF3179)
MKKLFYLGLAGLGLFEILDVYFIMPMPGSQRMNSIGVAYFLYDYRWIFRTIFVLMMAIGAVNVFRGKRKWLPAVLLFIVLVITYYFNFKMTADHMFGQPAGLTFKSKEQNLLPDSGVVISVANQGQVKAYPIRYIVYHHQVQDTVGGKPVIVTYCSVCRTGRVFEPTVGGKHEKFRLVGMDHFNAMFEDATTHSWWRQVTGEAIAGKLTGEALPEVESNQLTIGKLFALYPNALVMQPDPGSTWAYDSLGRFERGKSRNGLTRRDSISWKDKSWVVGIKIGSESKAYDWTMLKQQRVINDKLDGKPIVLVLSDDEQSFSAFERPADSEPFTVHKDTLIANGQAYDFSGRDLTSTHSRLKGVKAYQEFWHSWKTFHPETKQYN